MCDQPLRVVRAYQKLIYAPEDQQAFLIQEYKAADQSGRDRVTPESSPEPGHSQPHENNPVDGEHTELPSAPNDGPDDYFDPGLVSQTAVSYPNQGAQIDSFRILALDGRPVNVLLPGQDYTFEVSGKFLSDRRNIYFGIHMRSVSGTIITGQRYPEKGNLIEQVQMGESFSIAYGFKMVLLPGVYFVGGGVWSADEPTCLHRIVDASMFRIMAGQTPISFGFVDASSMQPRLNILARE